MKFRVFISAILYICFLGLSPACAQTEQYQNYYSMFEQAEEQETPLNPTTGSTASQAAQDLLGTGAPEPKKQNNLWGNFEDETVGMSPERLKTYYDDSYEQRVNKELSRPLTDPNPFPDRISDMENELKPKNSLAQPSTGK